MGKAIRASALILLLACSAQAGWMPNGSTEPPPPVSATQEPTGGEMPNGIMQNGIMPNDAPDTLTETALDLLALLPSLL